MRLTIATNIWFATVIVLASSRAIAAEQCPAINCDCRSLPQASWTTICEQHEATIKQRCVDNDNTPADYCLVHGLDAYPLPLSLKVGEVDESQFISLKDSYESIDGINNIMSGYMEDTKAFQAQRKYTKMLERLKLINSVMGLSFEQQQLISSTLTKQGEKSRKIERSWEKYANHVEFAESLQDYGEELTDSIKTASSAKEKKIFRVLAQKTYRLAGKRFEQLGYSFGKANMHKQAAESWKQASEISRSLSAISRNFGGKASSVKFSEFQTAARLQRASYHWLLGKSGDKALQNLAESQQYIDREQQQKIDRLVNADTSNNQDQTITGR